MDAFIETGTGLGHLFFSQNNIGKALQLTTEELSVRIIWRDQFILSGETSSHLSRLELPRAVTSTEDRTFRRKNLKALYALGADVLLQMQGT